MISEEYIEREKRVAECYKRYFDSRPELKKGCYSMNNLLQKEKASL